MIRLLPFLLFYLFAFPWEMPQNWIKTFNTLGNGATICGINLLTQQLAEPLPNRLLELFHLLDDDLDKPIKKEAVRAGWDSFLTAGSTTLLLKAITHCKRPTGNHYDSFPSGHTAVAFASARVFSHYYPENRAIYYILAVGVAVARVQSKAHYVRDVIGGAIVGYWGGEMALEGKGILSIIKKKF